MTAGENVSIENGIISAVNVSGREVEMSYDADNDRLKFNTGEELSIKPNAGYRVVASSSGTTYKTHLQSLYTPFINLSVEERIRSAIIHGNGETLFRLLNFVKGYYEVTYCMAGGMECVTIILSMAAAYQVQNGTRYTTLTDAAYPENQSMKLIVLD